MIRTGWSAAILILWNTASEAERVRARRWVREMLKAPVVCTNVHSSAVRITWTLLSVVMLPTNVKLAKFSKKSFATLQAKSKLHQSKRFLIIFFEAFQESDWVKWMSEWQVKGQSCPRSLSQVEVRPGTSYRSCRSGGCRRTVEPVPRLGCYPAASQSTSTHYLL